MTEIHGPLYYNTLGKQACSWKAMRTSLRSTASTTIPYYNDFVTRLGFEKECDWGCSTGWWPTMGSPDKTRRVAKIVQERYNLHFGSIDRLKKDPEQIRKFFKMYNDSFADAVYNFIPFTDEERGGGEVRDAVHLRQGELPAHGRERQPRGLRHILPEHLKALQKARGHLFPFGWIHCSRAEQLRDHGPDAQRRGPRMAAQRGCRRSTIWKWPTSPKG